MSISLSGLFLIGMSHQSLTYDRFDHVRQIWLADQECGFGAVSSQEAFWKRRDENDGHGKPLQDFRNRVEAGASFGKLNVSKNETRAN